MQNVAYIVMLVLGVVLFGFSLMMLWQERRKDKSPLPWMSSLGLSFCMIGFSAIQSFKIPNVLEVNKVAEYAEKVRNNPNDTNAVDNLDRALNAQLAPADAKPLPPAAKSELESTVALLSQKTNLPVDSRVTLAKAQLLLGHTNEAAATFHAAVKAHPNVKFDARSRMLIQRLPGIQ